MPALPALGDVVIFREDAVDSTAIITLLPVPPSGFIVGLTAFPPGASMRPLTAVKHLSEAGPAEMCWLLADEI